MAPKNEVVMEDRRRLPGHGQKKWPLLVRSLSDSAKYLTRNSSSTSALAPASSSHQQSPKSAVETKALTLSLSDSRLFSICTSIGSSNNRWEVIVVLILELGFTYLFLKTQLSLSTKIEIFFTCFLLSVYFAVTIVRARSIIPHFWTFGVTRILNCVVAGVTKIWQRKMTKRKTFRTRTKAALS